MAEEQITVETFVPEKAVYTPTEISAYGLQAIQSAHQGDLRAIGIGIPTIQDYFAPVRPGQVVGVIGQTSHFKSGLMHLIEHTNAKTLWSAGRERSAIVHISVEEDVEEQALLEFARYTGEDADRLYRGEVANWDNLIRKSYEIASVPIFYIGDSLARADDQQPLHLTNIDRSLSFIRREFKLDIAMVTIDYLQAIPNDTVARRVEDDTQRRLQVRRDAYVIKKLATKYNCPFWVPCQAKQALTAAQDDKRSNHPLLIPDMYDINESADVSQRFDRLIGIWLPCRSYPVGTKLKIGRNEITVTEDLFFIKVIKQRGRLPAGRVYICKIDFITNSITVMKEQAYD